MRTFLGIAFSIMFGLLIAVAVGVPIGLLLQSLSVDLSGLLGRIIGQVFIISGLLLGFLMGTGLWPWKPKCKIKMSKDVKLSIIDTIIPWYETSVNGQPKNGICEVISHIRYNELNGLANCSEEKLSQEEIDDVWKKYEDFVTIMKTRAPRIFRIGPRDSSGYWWYHSKWSSISLEKWNKPRLEFLLKWKKELETSK